jgi:hypothetical protein
MLPVQDSDPDFKITTYRPVPFSVFIQLCISKYCIVNEPLGNSYERLKNFILVGSGFYLL